MKMQLINRVLNNRVLKNSAALIMGKVVQMVLSFIVSIISARFLGPSNFGLINYAGSIVTFLIPIASLGINGIIAYEAINHPEEEGKIFGTSLIMQMLSGMLCIVGAVIVSFVLNPYEWTTIIIVALYSILLLFKCFETLEYWFQIHFLAKYVAVSGTIAYIVSAAYKVLLLAVHASVYWFSISMTLDYVALGVIYLVYHKKNNGAKLEFSHNWIKPLWNRGKSFIIAGLMTAVYLQTDKIMLKGMIDETEVGYYAIAASMASLWGVVLGAFINSSNPIIIECKKKNETLFENALIGRYSLVFYSTVIVAATITLLSKYIIVLLYGETYQPAAPLLSVLIWGIIFTYWGNAKSLWFIANNMQKYIKWLSVIGAISNIVLNYFLIKMYGKMGAAIATVITECVVNVLAALFIKPIRQSSILMIKSIRLKSLKHVRIIFRD